MIHLVSLISDTCPKIGLVRVLCWILIIIIIIIIIILIIIINIHFNTPKF